MSFDLNKCEKDGSGHWICATRGGRPVRVVCTNAKTGSGGDPCLLALVSQSNTLEAVMWVRTNGRVYSHESENDLVNIPRKIKRWVCVHKDNSSIVHDSQEKADKYIADAFYKPTICVPIEWEENQ